jgi:hypothetical protein
MALSADSRARFNLKDANVLVVEGGSLNMDILVQMLFGFGAKNLLRNDRIDDAKTELGRVVADLIFVGDHLADGHGCDLDAIKVHVEALHLFRRAQLEEGGRDAQGVLLGLRRVRERYAANDV